MEIVLGIDNIVFISVLVSRLPKEQADRRRRARAVAARLVFRIPAAAGDLVDHRARPSRPFDIMGFALLVEGSDPDRAAAPFVYKATHEMHAEIEEPHEGNNLKKQASTAFRGRSSARSSSSTWCSRSTRSSRPSAWPTHVEVMIAAVIVAVGVMFIASGPVARFRRRAPDHQDAGAGVPVADRHVALVADGLGFHIPKGYIYAAMGFSVLVEAVNIIAKERKAAQPGPLQGTRLPSRGHAPATATPVKPKSKWTL